MVPSSVADTDRGVRASRTHPIYQLALSGERVEVLDLAVERGAKLDQGVLLHAAIEQMAHFVSNLAQQPLR